MVKALRPAVVVFVVLTVLTGVVYPLAVTIVAWGLFPVRAGGSVIVVDGRAVGSELIGQPFHSDGLFWGRPSATGPVAYNASASSGSNLGPSNPALLEAVGERVATLRSRDPELERVPVDLVTASGSGLDPHISPGAAEAQVARVAKARGVDEGIVRDLVRRHTQGRQLGLLGEPRVNVLRLNLALLGGDRTPGEAGARREADR